MLFLFLLALSGGASLLASRLDSSDLFFNSHPAIMSSGRAELPLCPNKKHGELASSSDPIMTEAHYASDSLSPPNGERAGVRGQYLKINRLLNLILFSTKKI
jgi:hypothetical protein